MNYYGIIYCAYNKINEKRYIGQTIQNLSSRKSKHYTTDGCPYFHHALLKYAPDKWEWKIIDTGASAEELNQKERFWIEFFHTTQPDYGYNLTSGGQSNVQWTSEQIRNMREVYLALYGTQKKISNIHKNIRCIEMQQVFKNAAEASRIMNVHHSHIVAAANGRLKSAGGYHWEWCIDLTYFPNAIYCVELDKIFLTLYDAHQQNSFSTTYLGRALKKQGSPCIYAGYTFYKINS